MSRRDRNRHTPARLVLGAVALAVLCAPATAVADKEFGPHGGYAGLSWGGLHFASDSYDQETVGAIDLMYTYNFRDGRRICFGANFLWSFFYERWFEEGANFVGPSPGKWYDTDDPPTWLNSLVLLNGQIGYAVFTYWLRIHAGAGLGFSTFDTKARDSYEKQSDATMYLDWHVAVELLPRFIVRPTFKYIRLYSVTGDPHLNGGLWLLTAVIGF